MELQRSVVLQPVIPTQPKMMIKVIIQGFAEECNSPTRNSIIALDRRHGTEESGNGVFKARIPIARLRNALDDEDTRDRGGFRCAECLKCLTCKTSNKRTAISLREAREQQLIEESVKIDLSTGKLL